jgi:hypothetical protein
VCEQLLFVLNQTAALQALVSASNRADVAANGDRSLVLRRLCRIGNSDDARFLMIHGIGARDFAASISSKVSNFTHANENQ